MRDVFMMDFFWTTPTRFKQNIFILFGAFNWSSSVSRCKDYENKQFGNPRDLLNLKIRFISRRENVYSGN